MTNEASRFDDENKVLILGENWSAFFGLDSHGLRSNAGTMEYKNRGGNWSPISSAAGTLSTTTDTAPASDTLTYGATITVYGSSISLLGMPTAWIPITIGANNYRIPIFEMAEA